MDVTQATAILVLCSGYDNRKVTTENAHALHLLLQNVRFDDAQQAVLDHYRETHRWIMPADILAGVARISKARREAREQSDLPAELEGMEDGPAFTAAYLEWQRTGEVPQRQLTA